MSAKMTQARQNRVLALHTVAARNADPVQIDDQCDMTFRQSRRAKFMVVEGTRPTPWQTEEFVAA